MRHFSSLLLATIAFSGLAIHTAYGISNIVVVDSVGAPADYELPGHYGLAHASDPNNFQLETVTNGTNILTVGLRVSQRGIGSITPNTGTDVYPVQPGYAPGRDPVTQAATPQNIRSWWNFEYYVSDSNGTVNNPNLSVTINGVSLTSAGNITLNNNKPAVGGGLAIEPDDNIGTGNNLENSEEYLFFAPATYNAFELGDYNFQINASDGALNASTNAVASVVPEPASLGLLGAGALALLSRRRRA